MTKRYTVGFLFSTDLSRVLLIHKLTPEWQKGRVNGIGGKYEGEETAHECIVREMREEAAVETTNDHWQHVGRLHGEDWSVDILAARHEGSEDDAQSLEEQQVEWFSVAALPTNVIANVHWIVPLCVDVLQNGKIHFVDARYRE